MSRTLHCRAGIVVAYIPATTYRPARYSVRIRDFKNRIYSAESQGAPDDYRERPQYFAEKRIAELGLDWQLTGCTYLESVGHVFTLGG